MFTQINTANNLLKILVEQSDHRAMIQKKRHSKRPSMQQRRARKSARSLHNTIIRGKCWSCPCRDQHAVHFLLKYSDLDKTEEPRKQFTDSRFRMIFSPVNAMDRNQQWNLGHEVETESEGLQSDINPESCCPPNCITGKMPAQRRVQFSIQGDESIDRPTLKPDDAPIILNICVTLSKAQPSGQSEKPFGCFSDDSHRHNMYYVRNIAADLKTRSLSELIAESSDNCTSDRFQLTRKQRLRLAVDLACSVLQFEGNWLKTYWRSKDILFNTAADIENPYVQWKVRNDVNLGSMCKGKAKALPPLIQSEILFPLGLVLVELSLCQTLETLRRAEDEDRMEACADLKTAARNVDLVGKQSGDEYKRVVKTCLFWHGTEEFDLDDEGMQDEMFRLVISPLIETLREFDGRKYGHLYRSV